MVFTKTELVTKIDEYFENLSSTILLNDEELEYENPILNISFNASVGDSTSPEEKTRKNYNVNLNFKPTK